VAPDAVSSPRPAESPIPAEVVRLFHSLNNQLGVILANAELLEHRLSDESHRVRATQVVSGTLEAITTAQRLRQLLWTNSETRS